MNTFLNFKIYLGIVIENAFLFFYCMFLIVRLTVGVL